MSEPYVTTRKIRFADEDHAGLVYFPRFLHFFHCAFEDMFEDGGIPYRACLNEHQTGWPAVRVETDFRAPLRFGDRFEIEVSVIRVGNKSATFRYRGRIEGQSELIAEAKVTVACVDMGSFKAKPIPEMFRALFERHQLSS